MQIIITLIIIIVLCFVLNIDFNYILIAADVLLCLFAVALILGFLYCFIRLLCSKRKSARFVRLENYERIKRKVAIYNIEDTEYPCAFPAENILNNQLYSTDKTFHVMLDIKKNRVYDTYSVLTCIIGLCFSIGLCVVLILYH